MKKLNIILFILLLSINCTLAKAATFGEDTVSGVKWFYGTYSKGAVADGWYEKAKLPSEYSIYKTNTTTDWAKWAGEYTISSAISNVIKNNKINIGTGRSKVTHENGTIYGGIMEYIGKYYKPYSEIEIKVDDGNGGTKEIEFNHISDVRVQQNQVNALNNTRAQYIYGGYIKGSGVSALANEVVMTTSSINGGGIYGGFVDGIGDAQGNSVSLSSVARETKESTKGSAIATFAISMVATVAGMAGTIMSGGAAAPTALFLGASLLGAVNSGIGFADDGAKGSYTVALDYGKIVVGGGTLQGNSTLNNVYLVDAHLGGKSDMDVIGGYAKSGTAVANNIIAKNFGKPKADVNLYGGYVENSCFNKDGCDVTFRDKAFSGTIGNTVVVEAGKYGTITGGYAKGANADSVANQVLIYNLGWQAYRLDGTNGNVDLIYGGYAQDGHAYENSVTINNARLRYHTIIDNYTAKIGSIYGGYAKASAHDNKVTITGSYIENNIYGGMSDQLDAYKNIVEIANSRLDNHNSYNVSNIEARIYGGYAINGNAYSNLIKLMSIEQYSDYGYNYNYFYGGYSQNGDVQKNVVWILPGASGNEFKTNYFYGGYSVNGNANNNGLIIENTSINKDSKIYGGYSQKGEAKSNTVVIKGNGGVDKINSTVHGSNKGNDNDLYLYNTTRNAQLSVKIQNFDYVYYVGTAEQYSQFYKVTYTKDVKKQDFPTYVSIKANEVPTADDILDPKGSGSSGGINGYEHIDIRDITSATTYDGYILKPNSNGDLEHVYVGTYAREEAKALSEGSVARAAAITQNSQSLSDALSSASATAAGIETITAGGSVVSSFGSVGAGQNRYQTGSHIETSGINIVLGTSFISDFDGGRLLAGPFVEYAYSDYDTFNETEDGELLGDGESHSYGAGVFGRFESNDFGGAAAFIEGSAKVGHTKNKYHTTIDETSINYTSNATYYGAHIGGGVILRPAKQHKVEFYAKYFYNHLGSDDVRVDDSNVHFEAIDSHLARVGATYFYEKIDEKGRIFAPYVGLAWDEEFSGDAKATTNGRAITAPSLQGSSALIQAGIKIDAKSGLSGDFGLNGYAGKRQGVNANISLKYKF